MPSWPSENDLGCGLQGSWSSGMRSSNRWVRLASSSSSIRIVSAIGIAPPCRTAVRVLSKRNWSRRCRPSDGVLRLEVVLQHAEAARPTFVVLVAVFEVREVRVRQQNLSGAAQIVEFHRDHRFGRSVEMLPSPREHQLLRGFYFL